MKNRYVFRCFKLLVMSLVILTSCKNQANISNLNDRKKELNFADAFDKHFHDIASKDKKEIIGLDEIQTQLALFDFEVPFKMQVKIIEKAASEMEMKAKGEEALFQAYFANDMTKFEQEFLKPFDFEKPQMKKMYDRVFTDRNTKWVEKLEELSKENSCTYLVLVGAGHYFGPNNILELLKNKGYIIEKI